MKLEEKKQCSQLRREGFSINEIVKKTGCSKSSISLWVRDIELTSDQKKRISKRGHSIESIEKRRITRLRNEQEKRDAIQNLASEEIQRVSDRDLFFLGVSLYWGEGSKTKRGAVEFVNSDPRLIQIMMRFFIGICEVPAEKFRGHVYLHPHLSAQTAEEYWCDISGIPLSQFHKTTQAHNRASQNKKDSLPYGTFMIGVYDTKLHLKIKGWMDGITRVLIQ